MASIRYYTQKAGFQIIWGLVFFVFLQACSANPEKENEFILNWDNGKPGSLTIHLPGLSGDPLDSIKQNLIIKLENSNQGILGQTSIERNNVFFKPLLPFTRGLKYEIWYESKFLGELTIPFEKNSQAPEIISIHPNIDRVPENLLKIHIEFSRPMEEGAALKNIFLTRNIADTLPSPFLDLDQELWNKEGTVITVWMDPGRIKRDLQPNSKLGPPLEKGNEYTIQIRKEWRDRDGRELEKGFSKDYLVVDRDNISPGVAGWTLYFPKAHTKLPLKVWLDEPIDFVLLHHAIHIINEKGEDIPGTITLEEGDSVLYFLPDQRWEPGTYALEAESRLEDLAGNNLGRLFDEDITKEKQHSKNSYRRSFTISE